MKTFEALLEHIDGLWIVDTHEHMPMEADRPTESDVLAEYVRHYFSSDLVSAGLASDELEAARDPAGDLMERWKLVEPYWQAARSTGYGRALDISARGIYGIDGVSAETIGPLNEAFIAARNKGDHYQYVLKDKSRIAISIVDSNLKCDRKFFASTARFGDFLCPKFRVPVQRIGMELGVRVHDLDDWTEALARAVDGAFKEQEAVTIKCGLAYHRTLHFEKVTRAEAEEQFNEAFTNEHSPARQSGVEPGKAVQDYMMHQLLKLADQRGLPFQFHTGIQEGVGNVITNSNPTLLTNLFLEYPNVKFDIFHMGYPYMQELSNLAKNFRNVYIDMCWGHIISPTAARRALVEWLDAVPANKISAFGGDYAFVDAVYGHQRIAREDVAASLAQKVEEGSFDIDRAKQIAKWVFVDNPTKLFALADRIKEAKSAPGAAT